MATSTQPRVEITQPLLNSIPEYLVSRYEPQFIEHYNNYQAGRLATHQVPIEEFRANTLKYIISWGRQNIDSGGLQITEQKCPVQGGDITIRIFEPAASSTPRPVYVNFHGGGWVFGGLATDNDWCKRVALELDCVAFDVDYRLAPEYKYPIPINDSWEAFNWVRRQNKMAFLVDQTAGADTLWPGS